MGGPTGLVAGGKTCVTPVSHHFLTSRTTLEWILIQVKDGTTVLLEVTIADRG